MSKSRRGKMRGGDKIYLWSSPGSVWAANGHPLEAERLTFPERWISVCLFDRPYGCSDRFIGTYGDRPRMDATRQQPGVTPSGAEWVRTGGSSVPTRGGRGDTERLQDRGLGKASVLNVFK
ncbi:hypothetical protein EYF80_029035 [Liparis tanakae]|uniref:Uncharacterized protein n=1 Tax=Liparis tanakae TaxID=230148 RepID=A0A4Z2H4Y4_9TELE|nr:hypothetical protein EYF80_029035 [Liparis tanakae]